MSWDRDLIRISIWMLIAFLTAALMSEGYPIWSRWSPHSLTLRGLLYPSILLLAVLLPFSYYVKAPLVPPPLLVPAVAVIGVSCTGWFQRDYSLYSGYALRGELALFALLYYLFLWKLPNRRNALLLVFLLLIPPICFLVSSGGRLLFSDDHPTFLYRLTLLKEMFPHVPFYNPLWNLGLDERDFFATGAFNVYFLFLPLLTFLDPRAAQIPIIIGILFVLLPLSSAAAATVLGAKRLEATIAAVLAVTNSLTWYQWALQYGTLGFLVSCALLPLNIAIALRFLDTPSRPPPSSLCLFFVLSFSIMLLWTPSGLLFIPLILVALFCLPLLIRQNRSRLTALALLILNTPWLVAFWKVSSVGSFLSREKIVHLRDSSAPVYEAQAPAVMHSSTEPMITWSTFDGFREIVSSSNLLILFFAAPGLALFSRRVGIMLGAVLLWAGALGVLGPMFKPQLELHRMILIAMVVAAVPAARAVTALLTSTSGKLYRIAQACVFGTLIAGILGTAAIMRGRSSVPLYFERSPVRELTNTLRTLPSPGRVLFSGFVLHDLSNGHLAPIALWSGKPLIASSHIHNMWRYTHVLPDDILKGNAHDLRSYLDLLNVSYVLTHERRELRRFSKLKKSFRQVTVIGPFTLFERIGYRSNYFLKGDGEILEQTPGRVVFQLSHQSPEVVLKFRYFPFLQSTACSLKEERVRKDLSYIRLINCPVGTPITLSSVGLITRIFGRQKQ